MNGGTVTAMRAVLVGLAAFALLVGVPRLLTPAEPAGPPLHGEMHGDTVTYTDATLADVLDDIGRETGFRAVALPDIATRRFSGSLQIGEDGQRAAAELARKSGFVLRMAGPHWVIVEP